MSNALVLRMIRGFRKIGFTIKTDLMHNGQRFIRFEKKGSLDRYYLSVASCKVYYGNSIRVAQLADKTSEHLMQITSHV